MDTQAVTVRTASVADVQAIVAVLRANLSDPSLFQRSSHDIRFHIGEFLVAVVGGETIGCACVHPTGATLAEVSTVAVDPTHQGRGIGRRLVEASLAQAERRGFDRVWLGTAKPEYFRSLGFDVMSRWDLPIGVLIGKLPGVFRQPIARWPAVLLGKLTYMHRSASRP